MKEIGIGDVRLWIENHRNDIIEDMRRIVNIRSVSEPESAVKPFGEGCREALDAMLAMASEKGLETDNFDYYGGRISLHTGTDGKEIGIWSHLDVVPEGSGWTFPPYEMTVLDDFLIGRGVQDNKSSAVGILYVLLCLKELGIPLKWNYSLYMGCSEENTMDDVSYLITHVRMPELSLVADCGFPVCYGEMGNLSLEFETKEKLPEGIISIEGGTSSNSIPERARIVFRPDFLTEGQKEQLRLWKNITVLDRENETTVEAAGMAAHIINPEQGINAVTVLGEALAACGLEGSWLDFVRDSGRDGYGTGIGVETPPPYSAEDPSPTCPAERKKNGQKSERLVGGISGLTARENKLRITADYRYPVLDAQGNRSDGLALAAQLQETAKRYGLTMDIRKNSAAMYRPPEDPVVRCLTESYQKYSGYDNPAYTMSGGTYARKLPNAMGFGMSLPGKKIYRPDPSRSAGDFHQADESINLSQLLEAMAIYAMCLIDLGR